MKVTRGLLAGIALTLAMAGCGAEAGGSAEQKPATGGGAPSLALTSEINELAKAVSTQSASKQSAKLTFEDNAAGQKMTGDGAYRVDGTEIAMRMSMNTSEGAMEMVIVDQVLYLKASDKIMSSLGTDKEWLRISPDGTDPISQTLAPLFEQLEESTDVAKSMEKFKKAGAITKSARETLDGAQVAHYWLTVDLAKLASATEGELGRKGLEDQVRQGVTKIEGELWLTVDNLPAKMTMQMPVPNMGTGTTTMTFRDWGQPVDITAPPADKVGTVRTR